MLNSVLYIFLFSIYYFTLHMSHKHILWFDTCSQYNFHVRVLLNLSFIRSFFLKAACCQTKYVQDTSDIAKLN